MDSFFTFLQLIKDECSSLLQVVPPFISVTILAALSFILILGVMRIWALIIDDIPFI